MVLLKGNVVLTRNLLTHYSNLGSFLHPTLKKGLEKLCTKNWSRWNVVGTNQIACFRYMSSSIH